MTTPGYRAFTDAGKPVFQLEYVIPLSDFCDDARDLGFNSIKKSHTFSLYATPYGICFARSHAIRRAKRRISTPS